MTAILRIKTLVGKPGEAAEPKIAVFGDSHTAALIRAQRYSKRSEQYEHVRVLRFRKEKEGKIVVGDVTLPALLREIRDFSAKDFVFSALGGNQYAIVSTVRPPVEYDVFASPADEPSDPDMQLVPMRALASFIESGIRESVASVLKEIRHSTNARMYHLVPPPPKSDNDFIAAHAEGYFAKEGLRELGPTRPDLRLRCWKVQLRVLTEVCGELGIDLVMPPDSTVTHDGYLDPAYYAKDVTHANRRYGEAVLKQIVKISKSKARAKRPR